MPTHTRVDRWYGYADLDVRDHRGDPAGMYVASVAYLAPEQKPTAQTQWTQILVRGGQVQQLFAGPDASPTAAVVVPEYGLDWWVSVSAEPEVSAHLIAQLRIA